MPIEIESPEMMGYNNVKFNLTESSVFDANLNQLNININELVLCYGNHIGNHQLRSLIASEHKDIQANDVLITAGASTALFIVNTSLLNANDEVIVFHPNYGTNIETPRAIGCNVILLELEIENDFKPDLEKLKSLITPKTKLISITTPHNPTGMQLSDVELIQIIEIAAAANCYLLVDETYRDIPFGSKTSLAASYSEFVISLSSVSKAYGLPGLRIGWLITKNKKLQKLFLAAKEQIQICNSVVDEEIALQFLMKKSDFIISIREHINTNYSILEDWLHAQNFFKYVLPVSGCVCFPKLNIDINIEKFYSYLNSELKTFVGNGHWFEMDKEYMRIGFGWPQKDELIQGLQNISDAIIEINNLK